MGQVLLLNASYEPLRVLPSYRAVQLIVRGLVEPASSAIAASFRSPSVTLSVPTVVRLRYYERAPRRNAQWSKRAVLHRDQYTCIYCGVRLGEVRRGQVMTRANFTIDHIVPRSQGGLSTWTNTACACAPCNHRKDSRTPGEAGMRLLWEPKTPRVGYVVIGGEIPESWKIYLAV